MNKNISSQNGRFYIKLIYCISIILLLQSCKGYQSTSVSLRQAYEAKSQVKLKAANGSTTYYNSITFRDSIYCASTGITHIPIYPYQVKGVYLKKKAQKKNYKIRVLFLDEREEIRGYLQDVTDSSIIISPTNNEFQLIDEAKKLEIPVSQINKIKNSVRQAAIIGFIPGLIGGALIGSFVGAYDSSGNGVIGGIIGGIIFGGITSGIATAFSQKIYRINGDRNIYQAKYLPILETKLLTPVPSKSKK